MNLQARGGRESQHFLHEGVLCYAIVDDDYVSEPLVLAPHSDHLPVDQAVVNANQPEFVDTVHPF